MSEYSSGRLVAVDKRRIGRRLVGATAAGATSLTVNSTVVFDEDGGHLFINGQSLEYTGFDEETGEITLASGQTLAEAADEGDRVLVWDPAYEQPVTKMVAQVDIDDDADDEAGEPLEATVALHLQKDLAPGLRPEGRGEVVLLDFDEDDDEWRVVDVLGLDGRDGTGMQAEADDAYAITAADVAAGVATMTLSHTPIAESVKGFWGVLPQEPTEYTVSGRTVTWPLDGVAVEGDRLWVHYWYLVEGVTPEAASGESLYPPQVMADGPLFYYRLDETSGTFAADSSGNDNHGKFYPGSTAGAVTLLGDDPEGAAGLFSGGDGHVYPDPPSIPLQTEFTAEAIVEVSGLPPVSGRIFSRMSSTNVGNIFYLGITPTGEPQFYVRATSGDIGGESVTATGPTSLDDGQPHHVAATWSNTDKRLALYVDGVEVASAQATQTLNNNNVTEIGIGANADVTGQGFNGVIDEAAYYAHRVSAARIAAHHAAWRAGL